MKNNKKYNPSEWRTKDTIISLIALALFDLFLFLVGVIK